MDSGTFFFSVLQLLFNTFFLLRTRTKTVLYSILYTQEFPLTALTILIPCSWLQYACRAGNDALYTSNNQCARSRKLDTVLYLAIQQSINRIIGKITIKMWVGKLLFQKVEKVLEIIIKKILRKENSTSLNYWKTPVSSSMAFYIGRWKLSPHSENPPVLLNNFHNNVLTEKLTFSHKSTFWIAYLIRYTINVCECVCDAFGKFYTEK